MDQLFSTRFDKYKLRRDNLPRVLFRGWHSGTRATALGLNSPRGVYPFAWQNLLPASNTQVSREPPSLPSHLDELSKVAVTALASKHIGSDFFQTPFTSWTADLATAVWFSMGSFGELQWEMNEGPGFVAVVDLSYSWPVIHVPDLGWTSLPQEWLIYGPVTRVRVVSVDEIRNTICTHWPSCYGSRHEPHHVTEEEIRDSVRVGLLFQDKEDKEIDITLVVAASLLSWGQTLVPSPRPLSEADILSFETQQVRPWPSEDIQSILRSRLLIHGDAVPPLSGTLLGNSLTSTVGAPQLQLTIQLLTEMQTTWVAATTRLSLAREEWEANFAKALSQYSPTPHSCIPIRCESQDEESGGE